MEIGYSVWSDADLSTKKISGAIFVCADLFEYSIFHGRAEIQTWEELSVGASRDGNGELWTVNRGAC